MKRFFVTLSILLAYSHSYAQKTLDVANIPAGLTRNASVVTRYEEKTYEVTDPGNAIYNYKKAITILNKNAERASEIYEFYDKFSNIYDLKASLYDASGNKTKEFKAADFQDRSAISDGSIYEDNRVKALQILSTDFPYTIEYSYSIKYTGIRFYPSWNPVSSWGSAVQSSRYTFRIPETMTFKYLKNKGMKTDSLKINGKIQYTWSCENIPAVDYEPMSTGFANLVPWVTLAPNQFEYDRSKANIETWNSLGTWMFNLSKDLQILPEKTKAKVRDLVKDASSPNEKMRILYHYLQSNTRYVGVQLGIGGYKPIAAEKVSAVNYGDCKALSNYMKALLLEAGIASNLVVIGNNMPSLNPGYASLTQANHMILCVPIEKDTTWLECTSQFLPLGYIGNGNSDKTILLITEEGGKLARTPVYKPSNNYQKRLGKVALEEDGSAAVNIETSYGYVQYEQMISMMLSDPTAQRNRITNSLGIPNMQIDLLNYTQPDKDLAVIDEKINIKSSQFLTKGGDRLFLTLNLLNRQENTLAPITLRKTHFSVSYSYTDEDKIIYTIPKGYKVEFVPKEVSIESEFGSYKASVVITDNTIIYTRTKVITNKVYPPEKYNEYVAFDKKIYQADKQKSILAKIE